MLFELYVGLRYMRSRNRNVFVSVVSFLSVTIGVMVLVAVLSVMDGFQKGIRDSLLDFEAHILVQSFGETLSGDEKILAGLKEDREVVAAMPYCAGVVILDSLSRQLPVELVGVPPEALGERGFFERFRDVDGRRGEFDLGNGILLGVELAKRMGVTRGSLVAAISGRFHPGGGIEQRRNVYRVTGLFKTGHYRFDSEFAVVSLPVSRRIYGLDDEVHGIRVKIRDPDRADFVAGRLRRVFPHLAILTWQDLNQNLFSALRNEKVLMAFIVALIVLVASFTITSIMRMIVDEKRREIGILKAMGATPAMVRRIFVVRGSLVGVSGTFLGLCAGLWIANCINEIFGAVEVGVNGVLRLLYWTAALFVPVGSPQEFLIFSRSVYYLDTIPVNIDPLSVFLVCFAAIGMSVLASFYPAHQAGELSPVEVIRYE